MNRFFSPDSFWNTPIAHNAAIDAESEEIIDLITKVSPDGERGFWIGLHKWTVPVYEVNDGTPLRHVYERDCTNPPKFGFHHGHGFVNPVPIPAHAIADPLGDAHMVLVDWKRNKVWDMFGARKRDDGEWESWTGMTYEVDGPGVFDRSRFAMKDNESVHMYGPGRASGVPVVAGLIMHHEVAAGRIEHKLAFSTQSNALKRFVYPPAIWTDGPEPGGIPEGAVIQLDPSLSLDGYNLPPGARAVARALQEYGAVCVDHCGGHTLYGEGLYYPTDRSWDGLLDGADLFGITLRNFRVLRIESSVNMGDPRFYPKARKFRERKGEGVTVQ
jgi:hypothetical protein